MPNTPHSSRRRSPSRSWLRSRGPDSCCVLIGSLDCKTWPSQTAEAGRFARVAPRRPLGKALSVCLLVARQDRLSVAAVPVGTLAGNIRPLFVGGLLLEPLQDGVLGVLRQQRHQPLAGALQHHPRARIAHGLGLRFRRHQPVEENEGDHHDQKPARKAEQEAQGAVERPDSAVEHSIGKPHGQRPRR